MFGINLVPGGRGLLLVGVVIVLWTLHGCLPVVSSSEYMGTAVTHVGCDSWVSGDRFWGFYCILGNIGEFCFYPISGFVMVRFGQSDR